MKEFKIGDKVYDVMFQQWGKVCDVSCETMSPVMVNINKSLYHYTSAGMLHPDYKTRQLYHADETPEQLSKPAPIIKPGTIVEVWDDNPYTNVGYATGEFTRNGKIEVTRFHDKGETQWSTNCYRHYRIIEEPKE